MSRFLLHADRAAGRLAHGPAHGGQINCVDRSRCCPARRDGLVWSADRIASENQILREDTGLATLYMPFDPLLFFADAGNGDLFALLSRIDRPDVFAWNHEDDSRTWVAPSLAKYIEWRLTGQIEL
ncbi:SMI1/KNR4 family protein [Streptomyces sp. NPDC048304]|uniref:SMI1/KNR4 family protein n=1 Tax=Streptomyces sp. NPDC048304 TaxID=3154820 RepID=UPI0033EE6720